MKSLKYFVFVIFTGVLLIGGCDSNPLDIEPSDQITENDVWNDPALIEAYLNDAYRVMGHGAYQGKLSAISDNSHSIPDLGSSNVVQSTVTPGNLGLYSLDRGDLSHYQWEELYDGIRIVNVFFDEIQDSEIENQDQIDRLRGEAHFLRAYFYHNLLRMYGGVPIIEEPSQLGDELVVPRNSFGETVDFIVQEAESAADLLPTDRTGENLGRASGGAALALKSRVLLYAASDLYHENPSDMTETGFTGSEDRTQMWRDAKNVAQDVMDLGYSLFRANPTSQEEATQNYYELFLTQNTEETIFERYFVPQDIAINQGWEPNQYHGPNGFHQWGGNTPIQQLVDSYRMDDGSEFSWDNANHADSPYENRDPRFYASILYDGAEFRERPSDGISMDQDGVIQTFSQLELPNGNTVPGLDTRNSPIEPWNGTRSGYYMRKLIDVEASPSVGPQPNGTWKYFRFAEILLNYAEASIELGDFGDARQALNRIRNRAGMPDIGQSVTGQELMEEYRNERRVELAFEEHRYFDIRRWMIAPNVMDQNARGINITVEATDRADRSTYSNYEYEVISIQDRNWDDKMYFKPITQDEMNRNDELVQNPGYN